MPAYGDAFTGVQYVLYEFNGKPTDELAQGIRELQADIQSALSSAQGSGSAEDYNEAVKWAYENVSLLMPGLGDAQANYDRYQSEGDWNVLDELDTAIEFALEELESIESGDLAVANSQFVDALSDICAEFQNGRQIYIGQRPDALPYIQQNCGFTRWLQDEGLC